MNLEDNLRCMALYVWVLAAMAVNHSTPHLQTVETYQPHCTARSSMFDQCRCFEYILYQLNIAFRSVSNIFGANNFPIQIALAYQPF